MKKGFIKIALVTSVIFSLFTSCDRDPTYYNISYSSEHGTAPEDKEVESGYILTAEDLPTLTADGYTFKGWDKAEGDVITEDTTITASWDKVPAKTPEDDSSNDPANDPSKDPANDPSKDPSKTPDPVMYTITYKSEKGTAPESIKVEEGYSLKAEDLPALTDEDYDFTGWDKAVGDKITADTTITASWKFKQVRIIYSSAYGTAPETKTVDKGYKLTAEDLPFLGKDETNEKLFITWNKKVDDEITGDVTITANWQEEVYLSLDELYDYYEAKTIKFQKEAYDGGDVTQLSDVSGEHEGFYTAHYIEDTKDLIISGNGNYIIFAPTTGGFNSSSITSITFDDCITSYCEYMNSMFEECRNVVNLDLSSFDTSKVKNMRRMFYSCSSLATLDLSNFNTKNVTEMDSMFYNCSALESVNVSSFDTSNVTTMSTMFENCTKLASLDITNFNTKKVTSISFMFKKCENITSLDLSSFDTSNVEYIGHMFAFCSKLETIYVGSLFNLNKLNTQGAKTDFMFEGCSELVGGNGTTFSADHTGPDFARIDGGTLNPGYFTLKQ